MNKKVLITGASGFLAQILLEKIHADYSEIIITSRRAKELSFIEDKYSNVTAISGDLSDKDFASYVIKGTNLIFHLAAYKYVSLSEKNIMDSVNGNIVTTNNIFEAISKSNHPTDIKIVSTNKTHNIKGIYASTKYISERLARNYELEFDNINLSIIYLTNIFNSPGSISEIWKHAILNNQKLTVTDEKCTRFFLTKEQAVNLLIEQNIDQVYLYFLSLLIFLLEGK